MDEDFLSEDDTQAVFEAMYEARDKWRNIGGVFSVPGATLNAIRKEEKGDMDESLRRVIEAWLRQHGGTERCTWTAVADVLDNVTVGRRDLGGDPEVR